MLADQLDYIVGGDPHRDSRALAVVVFESTVVADSGGYAAVLELVERHTSGWRGFAVEGTGSFGTGLTPSLSEWLLEIGRLRRKRRSGGKTNGLDAVRVARRPACDGC
jgi:transposase